MKQSQHNFLPTTKMELKAFGWDSLDVILISGDTYIDSPYAGAAIIGRILEKAGFRVGIIAQPDPFSAADITRLGEPALFWGVTGGCVDSMVANYTASGKPRRSDDYTPGGENVRRPDRTVIVYTNLIRRYYKKTRPIVLGGMEASLRRVTHYDAWTDRLRAPILFDAKADYLLYGMADHSVLELGRALQDGRSVNDIRGLCYLGKEAPPDYLELPSFEAVNEDKAAFSRMFMEFYANNDPLTARGLYQRKGDRILIHNPPAPVLTQPEMDEIYALPFTRGQHPYYEAQGKVKAIETIRFSIPTHRGCYGECNFCAIAVHEGRTVTWRSPDSIVAEAETLTKLPDFKGIIQDLSGPTANMYGYECARKLAHGSCTDRRCLTPKICPALKVDHTRHLELLRRLRKVPGVKKVFIASGIRPDLIEADKKAGDTYLEEVISYHVSGQMKIAPEHTEDAVLQAMGKPANTSILAFKEKFDRISRAAGKNQFLTYYFIVAHPGCSEEDMRRLKRFASRSLNLKPEQVQIFTPTPSTISSLMYYTEQDPTRGEALFVEKNPARREKQKKILLENT